MFLGIFANKMWRITRLEITGGCFQWKCHGWDELFILRLLFINCILNKINVRNYRHKFYPDLPVRVVIITGQKKPEKALNGLVWSNTISQLFVDDSEARCFTQWGLSSRILTHWNAALQDACYWPAGRSCVWEKGQKYGHGASRCTVQGLERVPDSEDRNREEWEGAGSNLKEDFLTR